MTKVINKSGLQAAHYTKKLLSPAIEALQKVDTQALNSDPYAREKVTAFVVWLEKYTSKADSIINQAQKQLENKPEVLLKAAGLRFFMIPADINLHQKTIEQTIEGHKIKTEELRKKGFNQAEIEALIIYPQHEIDAHKAVIAELEVEQSKIEQFLADSPRFDVGLLDGARLEPFLSTLNSQQAAE